MWNTLKLLLMASLLGILASCSSHDKSREEGKKSTPVHEDPPGAPKHSH